MQAITARIEPSPQNKPRRGMTIASISLNYVLQITVRDCHDFTRNGNGAVKTAE